MAHKHTWSLARGANPSTTAPTDQAERTMDSTTPTRAQDDPAATSSPLSQRQALKRCLREMRLCSGGTPLTLLVVIVTCYFFVILVVNVLKVIDEIIV